MTEIRVLVGAIDFNFEIRDPSGLQLVFFTPVGEMHEAPAGL